MRVFEANVASELVVPYDAGSAIGEVHKVHVILGVLDKEDSMHCRVWSGRSRDRANRAMLR